VSTLLSGAFVVSEGMVLKVTASIKATIKEACNWALLAYQSRGFLESRYGDQITVIDIDNDKRGEFVYVLDRGDSAVVAIAGSNDILDWIRNLIFRKTKCKRYHAGFSAELDRIADQILEAVRKTGAKSVLVTGHSRGGGVAIQLVHKYRHYFPNDLELVVFAAPRALTKKAGWNISNCRFLNVIVGNDLVASLPLVAWGFKTYGHVIELGEKLSLWCRALRYTHAVKNKVKPTLKGIKDHLPAAYSKAVGKL